ncbi:MAG TPA: hypothetical protein VEI97_14090 [bacterium]|nr:hypothetical protein [bacterium]
MPPPVYTRQFPPKAMNPPNDATGAWVAPVLARFNTHDHLRKLVSEAMERWSTVNHLKFTVYRTQPKITLAREELLPEIGHGIRESFIADLRRGLATEQAPVLELLKPVDFIWLADILLLASGFPHVTFDFDYNPGAKSQNLTINIFPTPPKQGA